MHRFSDEALVIQHVQNRGFLVVALLSGYKQIKEEKDIILQIVIRRHHFSAGSIAVSYRNRIPLLPLHAVMQGGVMPPPGGAGTSSAVEVSSVPQSG